MEAYLKELEQIINMDSGTADVDGCWRVAAFLKARLRRAGLAAAAVPYGTPQRPLVAAVTPASSDDPLTSDKNYDFLFLGHLDTVFPAGTAESRPFRLHEAEGRVYGPGAVDMKAGALLMIYIAEYLLHVKPDISLCLLLNSDEETGSLESAPLLQNFGARCHRAFVFEGGRKQGQFVCQRKGCAKYEMKVSGIASHAGTSPQQGASAIVEAAHVILQLDKLKRYDRGTTVNVGLLEGGTALNMVADHCTAQMEVRYTNEQELSRIEKALSKLERDTYINGTAVAFTKLSQTPPLRPTPQTQELMAQMENYGRLLSTASPDSVAADSPSFPPVAFVSAGGLSDANRLAPCNIPIIDGCGPSGGFPHSEKEFLSIATVKSRFFFVTGLILHLCHE
ncbi:MAG: M20 family metallopeptidase [Firmicutes bacterium]|nr:M20 family metallopeptidase [Bacillota bacterium]